MEHVNLCLCPNCNDLPDELIAVDENNSAYSVHCSRCDSFGAEGSTRYRAIDNWNEEASGNALQVRCAELPSGPTVFGQRAIEAMRIQRRERDGNTAQGQIRDEIALRVLPACIEYNKGAPDLWRVSAEDAYLAADAMIAARSAGGRGSQDLETEIDPIGYRNPDEVA